MKQRVILRAEGPNRFSATSVAMPGVRAVAATEEKALEMLGEALADLLAGAKMVDIEVPDRTGPTNGPVRLGGGNPMLEHFGSSRDDPTFDAYLAAIEQARAEENRV